MVCVVPAVVLKALVQQRERQLALQARSCWMIFMMMPRLNRRPKQLKPDSDPSVNQWDVAYKLYYVV